MPKFTIKLGGNNLEILAPTLKDALAKAALQLGAVSERHLKTYTVPITIYHRNTYTVRAQNVAEAIKIASKEALNDKNSKKSLKVGVGNPRRIRDNKGDENPPKS